MFLFVWRFLLTTLVASLTHRSIAGGDSGELIAAVGTPPASVVSTLNQLAICAVQNPAAGTGFTLDQEADEQRRRLADDCMALHGRVAGVDMTQMSQQQQQQQQQQNPKQQDDEEEETVEMLAADQEQATPTATAVGDETPLLLDKIMLTFSHIPAEVTSAIRGAGLAHPPGYPLYLITVRFLVGMSYAAPLFGLETPGALANLVLGAPLSNSTLGGFQRTGVLYSLSRAFSGSMLSTPAQLRRFLFGNYSTTSTNSDGPLETYLRGFVSENSSWKNGDAAGAAAGEASSSSPAEPQPEEESSIDHRDFVEAEALVLADYVMRVNATSLVFSAVALLLTMLSVTALVLQLLAGTAHIAFSFLVAAVASILAVTIQLSSTTFLRYAGEAEVFSLNQAIVALGFFAFLSGLPPFSALVLGAVLAHQHAALFVAAPLVFLSILQQLRNLLVYSPKRKLLLILVVWVPSMVCFCVGALPVGHIYNSCIETPPCSFVAANVPQQQQQRQKQQPLLPTRVMPVLQSAWALPCRGDEHPKPYSHSECTDFGWHHVLRQHYGTFTMTDGSLQDQFQSKNNKKGKKKPGGGKSFMFLPWTDQEIIRFFINFCQRCERHWNWMVQEQLLALWLVGVGGVCMVLNVIWSAITSRRKQKTQQQEQAEKKKNNNRAKQHHQKQQHGEEDEEDPEEEPIHQSQDYYYFAMMCYCLLVCIGTGVTFFAAFSNMDLKDGSGNNIFMHVHERMWMQSLVPLAILAPVCLVTACRFVASSAAAAAAASRPRTTIIFVFIFASASGVCLYHSCHGAAAAFETVKRSREACEDCAATAGAVSMWRGVDLINGTSSVSDAFDGPTSVPSSSGRAVRFLFTSGDLHFAPIVVLEPYLRFLSLQSQLRKVRNAERQAEEDSASTAFAQQQQQQTKNTVNGSSSCMAQLPKLSEANKKKLTSFVENFQPSVTVWVDVEVGSRDWFTSRFLAERLRCIHDGDEDAGSLALPRVGSGAGSAASDAVASKVCAALDDARTGLMNLPRVGTAPRGKGAAASGVITHDYIRGFDIKTAVQSIVGQTPKGAAAAAAAGTMMNKKHRSLFASSVDIFSLELPAFTSLRSELDSVVDFQSNGPLYQQKRLPATKPKRGATAAAASSPLLVKECLTLERLYNFGELHAAAEHCEREAARVRKQHGKQAKQPKPDEIAFAAFSALFAADVWDHSIESGYSATCESAVRTMRRVIVSGSSSSKDRDGSAPSPPVHLAWLRQALDQCANAGKNKLVHALMRLQSSCGGISDTTTKKKKNKENRQLIANRCAHGIVNSLRSQVPHWTQRAMRSGLYQKMFNLMLAVNRSSSSKEEDSFLVQEQNSGSNRRSSSHSPTAEFGIWTETLAMMVPERRWAVVGPLAKVLHQVVDSIEMQQNQQRQQQQQQHGRR